MSHENAAALNALADDEFLSCGSLRARQEFLLAGHLRFLAAHSPYYQRLFSAHAVAPESFRSLDDLVCFPTTGKEELSRSNRDFLAVPESQIVDCCLSSGSTGVPVTMMQTRGDLERLAVNEALSFRRMGIGCGDRVLVAVALDRCFMAGLAYFLGLNRLGATVLRGGSGSLAHLMELLKNHAPTAIVGVPTLLLALAERLLAEGVAVEGLGVRRLVCIGEPVRAADMELAPLGQRLKRLWRAEVFNTYASTEMATAFSDCAEGRGGHFSPELAVVEILDEEGRPVAAGQAGEVTVSPLGVTGMPLLRFRSGDIAVLHAEPCSCGRRTPRLGPVLGRKAQMLKLRGTTVYPPAIFAVLQEFTAVSGYYLEIRSDYAGADQLRVVVASVDPALTVAQVAERIAARVRVKPEVTLASLEEVRAKTIQAGRRKPLVFFDYRSQA